MSTQRDRARDLLEEHGRTFADECGIRVERGTPSVLWQLLLMSHLLSARISSALAVRATRQVRRDFTTPQRMADATHRQVHDALSRGDYLRTRRTATMLRQTARSVLDDHGGDLRRLRDSSDPAAALQRFSGIREIGAEVFLREVQVVWQELRPFAGSRALEQARAHGLPDDPAALAALVHEDDVPRLMAALVRSGLS